MLLPPPIKDIRRATPAGIHVVVLIKQKMDSFKRVENSQLFHKLAVKPKLYLIKQNKISQEVCFIEKLCYKRNKKRRDVMKSRSKMTKSLFVIAMCLNIAVVLPLFAETREE
jgi:hypothetical protein